LPDLQPREWASVAPLCAMAIVMGVFPSVFLRPMEPSVRKVVERVQAARPVRVALPREPGSPPRVFQRGGVVVAGPENTATSGAQLARSSAEPR
jgi:hypothetical protein